MAMENSQLINNFPTNTSIYRGCSTATFDYRRLTQTSKKRWSFFHLLGNSSESGTCRDFFGQIIWSLKYVEHIRVPTGFPTTWRVTLVRFLESTIFMSLKRVFSIPLGFMVCWLSEGLSKKISVWSCVTPWCFSGWSRWQNPKFPVHPGAIFDTDLFCTFVRPGGFGMKGDC